jgi:methionine--tRNA ligase beta chain
MASFRNLCSKNGLDFDAYWGKDSTAELYHFIGKDILYFHSLFWPAILEGAGYRKPTKVFAHGFLTINGQKMSKSRGTFINARAYLDHLNPEYLRYYFAAKLGPGVEDIDLNFEDFVARVNSDLVGKYVNIASRTAGFVTRQFDGNLPWPHGQTRPHLERYENDLRDIADAYEGRRYQEVVRAVMKLADEINRDFDAAKPWQLAKDLARKNELGMLCTIWLESFRVLSIALHPILPVLTRRVARELFGMERDFLWTDIETFPARINPYQHLAARIEPKAIVALLGTASAATVASNHPSPTGRGAGGEGSMRSKAPLPEELREFARRLRMQQTDAEKLVWLLLRDRRVHNAKFRRQHPFESPDGRFVLDFYCQEAKLAVELDGGQHQERAHKDDTRTHVLEGEGIHVLRFWNNDVLADTVSVLEAIWNVLEERLPMTRQPSPPAPLPEGEGSKTFISIDDFSKIDLRIAKIVDAKYVEGADKLLQLTVDVGDEKPRNIFAGIRAAYEPDKLIGRLTVVVANLAPRKMKFGVSEGMVLAAGPGGKDLWILSPDEGAQPGMRAK